MTQSENLPVRRDRMTDSQSRTSPWRRKLGRAHRLGGEERFFLKVMNRMFAVVGKKYSPEVTATPEWYLDSTWTSKQEDNFRAFFIRNAMKDLGMPEHRAIKEAGWFVLWYGWKAANDNHAARRPASENARRSGRSVKVHRDGRN